MDIKLNEKEIKCAITNYVADCIGINLSNKELSITFSATRLEGMIAQLSIVSKTGTAVSNTTIPGYSDGTTQATAATEQPEVVETTAAAETKVEDTAAAVEQVAEQAAEEVAEVKEEVAETVAEAKPAKTTATLFGKPAATS